MRNEVFDRDKLTRFKIAYELACIQKHSSFSFEHFEYLTAYAKYVIEFLEQKQKEQKC